MPVSDELLLKLIYKEENQKALSEASAQFGKMTDAEKEFTKQNILAKQEQDKFNAATAEAIKNAHALSAENSQLKESASGAAGGFNQMQAGLVTLNAGIGVVKDAVGILKQGWEFAKEGAANERIQQQFDNLANSVSVDAAKLLSSLDKAAHGTVDDEQLMQTATRAMALGLSNNTNDLVKLMEIARASSVAFGGDTASAFERISTAVENLTPRALKQSGIIINLDKAYNDYAITLGKSADALTDEEKRQALLNDVLQKGQELVDKLGASSEDQLTKIQRLETGWQNLTDTIKEYLATVATDAISSVDLLANSEGKLADAFHGTADKMKKDVIDGKMSIDDYNSAIAGMGKAIADNGGSIFGKASMGVMADELVRTETVTQNLVDGFRILAKQASDAADQTKRIADEATRIKNNKATDLTSLSPTERQAAVKAFGDFQTKLTGIENKGDAERQKIVEDAIAQINKIESDAAAKRADIISKFAEDEANRLNDMRDKRIDILTSYSEAEQQITDEQNKNRLTLARSFGVEAERAEEDHQRNMARMAEDHGRRLSKLADSRDALGIEDEQANYQLEARRAEQDFQTTAQRRSEDYAQQLADLNASAEEQRQARAREKDKQLADLADQFAKQDERYQTAYQKQLADLDKQTEAQRREMQNAETKKLADQRIAQQSEHDAAIAQWTQWRNEHQIFFTGEKALYDDYLKHLDDQLRVYIGSGGGIPTAAGSTSSLGHKAMGGGVDAYRSYVVGENGPEILRMGSRGGYVEANGGMPNITLNIGPVNGGDPKALASELKPMIHDVIIEVFQAARK